MVLCALSSAACYRPPDVPPFDEAVGAAPCAPPRRARVACVLDGDTLDLEACGPGGERVRLLGVSAPELGGGGGPPECWAEQATAALERAVHGRTVLLTSDVDCEDAWGRTLAYVWLDDDLGGLAGDELAAELASSGPGGRLLVDEWLAAAGHARVFGPERFGELIWQSRLEAAEARAEAGREGLWGACVSPTG